MDKINYLVCVRCFTFNHSKYITDALNGFTMQQTNFPFICCVVDDSSTDGEQDVIKEYVNQYFDTAADVAFERDTDYANISFAQHKTNKNCYFAVLYLKYNHYSIKKNKFPYLSEWRNHTKFESLCEGDDYWIDPLKLQKQVDFLEANPDYCMCYTKCRCFYQNKNEFAKKTWGGSGTTLDDFMKCNDVPTLTVLVRTDLANKYVQDVCPQNYNWKMGDYPMWIWLAHESKIMFINIVTGVYRQLNCSASHALHVNDKIEFSMSCMDIIEYYNNKFAYGFSDNELQYKRYILTLRSYAIYNMLGHYLIYMCRYPKYLLRLKSYKYFLFFVSANLRRSRL